MILFSKPFQKDWLEAFDKAKKANLSQKQQPTTTREPSSERPPSLCSRGDSTESTNRKFCRDLHNIKHRNFKIFCSVAFEEPPAEPTPESLIPDWLCEAPDDLDVFIAQRHFEDAYTLIVKSQDIWHQIPTSPKLLDLQYVQICVHYLTALIFLNTVF